MSYHLHSTEPQPAVRTPLYILYVSLDNRTWSTLRDEKLYEGISKWI